MLDRIVAVLEAESVELPTLRILAYGGSKVALPLVRKALGACPTSASSTPTASPRPARRSRCSPRRPPRPRSAASDEAVARRLGSVGQPVPSIEVQIRAEDGTVLGPARPASCSCAASRCRAATPTSARCSTPTAGSPPRTLPCLTRTATCSSAAGPTTPSSAAARTSPRRDRGRARRASRTCATAWSSARGSGVGPDHRRGGGARAGASPEPDELRELRARRCAGPHTRPRGVP